VTVDHVRPADRRALVAAWLLAGTTVVSVLPNVALLVIPVRPGLAPSDTSAIQVVFDAALLAVGPAMGLLIVRRHPRNPVGWLFIAFPALLSLGFLGDGVARHAQPGPAVAWFVLISTCASNGAFLMLVLLLALFPNGRLISARWSLVPVLAGVATGCLLGSSLLAPRLIEDLDELRNPVASPGLAGLGVALNDAASIGITVALVLALAQFVVRFRHARGVERQQLKWFGFATSIVGVLLAFAATTELLQLAMGGLARAVGDASWNAAFSCFALLPVAAAIAMLRYRLYDIDRIVSRTITYTLVTAILALTFVGVVLAAQNVLAPLTHSNGIAVAASTLLVFALFAPLRRRASAIVDRRFNRARYDAQREADSFAAMVRDEVEAANVVAALTGVLERTVQPASAALWLRTDAE
jgi:hypothetical protein